MKKQLSALLIALIIIPCMIIIAACGGENHTHSWPAELTKDAEHHWYACDCGEIKDKAVHNWNNGVILAGDESTIDAAGTKTFTCQTCGQTKTESVAKLTPLFANADDFIAAVLDNEGNFSAEMTFTEQNNDGDSSTQSKLFEVSGLYSYVQGTNGYGYIHQEYDYISDEDVLDYYWRNCYDENWTNWGYDSGDYDSAFLYYSKISTNLMLNDIYLIGILQNETFIQDTNNPNKYSFQDENYLYIIKIATEDVILTITGEFVDDSYEASGTAVFTFTNFGTTEVEFPAGVQEIYDTMFMFGTKPDDFYINFPALINDSPQWTWEGDKVSEIYAFLIGKGFVEHSHGLILWNFDKSLIGNTVVCFFEDKLALIGPVDENDSMYAIYFTVNETENCIDADYYDEIEGVSYDGIVSLYSYYQASWAFYGETDRTDEFKQILINTGEWELDDEYSYSGNDGEDIAYSLVQIEYDECYIDYHAANGDYTSIRLTKITA